MFTSNFSLKYWLLTFFVFFNFTLTDTAQAKVFRNSYVSFELPNKWDCYLENTAWVCRYAISKNCIGKGANSKICKTQRKKAKEAIIVLAAKEVGPKDSLKHYYDHLKAKRPIIISGNKRATSKVIHIKSAKIKKHNWMDGMHLSSEIPHYYTRYLATVKGNIAVLVTFSAHKLYYTKYSNEFFRAIKSLRVLATKSSTVSGSKNIPNTGILGGANVGSYIDGALDEAGEDGFDGEASSGSDIYFIGGALLLALLGLLIWIKGRK